MRKIILGIIIVCFVGVLFMNMNEANELRVRIIPNSNLEEDIRVKENVKEMTICYLKEAYDSDYDLFLNNIKNTMDSFKAFVRNETKEKIEVELANHTLYNKTYNNSAVENTNELTLYITIGAGNGSNWWGTVYPEFLEVNSSEEIKYESLIASIFKKIKGDNDD